MKPFWQSKTIWVGVLEVVGGALTMIAGQLQVGAPITILGIVKIILRLVTKQPLGKKT